MVVVRVVEVVVVDAVVDGVGFLVVVVVVAVVAVRVVVVVVREVVVVVSTDAPGF